MFIFKKIEDIRPLGSLIREKVRKSKSWGKEIKDRPSHKILYCNSNTTNGFPTLEAVCLLDPCSLALTFLPMDLTKNPISAAKDFE